MVLFVKAPFYVEHRCNAQLEWQAAARTVMTVPT